MCLDRRMAPWQRWSAESALPALHGTIFRPRSGERAWGPGQLENPKMINQWLSRKSMGWFTLHVEQFQYVHSVITIIFMFITYHEYTYHGTYHNSNYSVITIELTLHILRITIQWLGGSDSERLKYSYSLDIFPLQWGVGYGARHRVSQPSNSYNPLIPYWR